MKFKIQQLFDCFLLFFLILAVFGCSPKMHMVSLSHPEFVMQTKKIKTVLFISPDVKIYELSTGGLYEIRDDWSKTGKANIQQALVDGLKEKSIEAKELTIAQDIKEEVEDIQALYKAIIQPETLNIISNGMYRTVRSYKKNKDFDYSVGSIEHIVSKHGADVLIIIDAEDLIATVGKKATTAAKELSLAFITAGIYAPKLITGTTLVRTVIIDPSGTILWQKTFFRIKDAFGLVGYDIRNPEDATIIVKSILADFKGLEK